MDATQQPDRRGTVTSGGSPEEIQRDIERTRAQLGRTADALAHRLDPKAQVKEKVGRVRRHRTAVVGGAAGVTALAVAAVVWRRTG